MKNSLILAILLLGLLSCSKKEKTPEKPKFIAAENIEINNDTCYLSMTGNKTTYLTASITPINATIDKKNDIKWSSLDTDIATVDENGKVTAISDGTTIIKVELYIYDEASSSFTTITDNCVIIVFNKYSLPAWTFSKFNSTLLRQSHSVIWSSAFYDRDFADSYKPSYRELYLPNKNQICGVFPTEQGCINFTTPNTAKTVTEKIQIKYSSNTQDYKGFYWSSSDISRNNRIKLYTNYSIKFVGNDKNLRVCAFKYEWCYYNTDTAGIQVSAIHIGQNINSFFNQDKSVNKTKVQELFNTNNNDAVELFFPAWGYRSTSKTSITGGGIKVGENFDYYTHGYYWLTYTNPNDKWLILYFDKDQICTKAMPSNLFGFDKYSSEYPHYAIRTINNN